LIESGISLVDKQDELIWTGGDKSGFISVKNVYEALSKICGITISGDGGENLEVGFPFEDKAIHMAYSRKQNFILEKSTKARMEGARFM
jgi:hypothetical protein